MTGETVEIDAGELARLRGIEERAERLAEGCMPPYRSGAAAAAGRGLDVRRRVGSRPRGASRRRAEHTRNRSGRWDEKPPVTMSARHVIAAAALGAVLATAGCAATAGPAAAPPAAPAAAQPAPTTAAQPTPAPPENVRLRLAVTSVKGDFGGYIVNDHTGPAKQTTFNVDKSGKWSKEIVVPNASMVKLDIARIGARCEIRLAENDEPLVTDENSCIVGS